MSGLAQCFHLLDFIFGFVKFLARLILDQLLLILEHLFGLDLLELELVRLVDDLLERADSPTKHAIPQNALQTRIPKHVEVIVYCLLVGPLRVHKVLTVCLIRLFLVCEALKLHRGPVEHNSFVDGRARHHILEPSHKSKSVFVNLLNMADSSRAEFIRAVVLSKERSDHIFKRILENMVHLHCGLLLEGERLEREHEVGLGDQLVG